MVYVEETAELALLRSFLNTRDHEHGEDGLTRPAALDAWLRDAGLPVASTATEADLLAARELRDALRGVLADPASDLASARLASVGAAFPLRLGDRAAGGPVLVPDGDGAAAAVGRIVAVLAHAQVRGTWDRLKVCPAEGCGWAFVDRSRNGSRRWCEMSSCGNEHKVRRYRARRRSEADTRSPG